MNTKYYLLIGKNAIYVLEDNNTTVILILKKLTEKGWRAINRKWHLSIEDYNRIKPLTLTDLFDNIDVNLMDTKEYIPLSVLKKVILSMLP